MHSASNICRDPAAAYAIRNKLYGTLSDTQKKKADQMLTGMGCMM